jgi:serine/threonine protein kinase
MVLPLNRVEDCCGGDLYERCDPYSEQDTARIVTKLLSAVAYMHMKGVVHRDLKFENILFENKRKDANIKLIDFGLSKKFKQTKHGNSLVMTELVGTLYTMAPQVSSAPAAAFPIVILVPSTCRYALLQPTIHASWHPCFYIFRTGAATSVHITG